MRPQRFIAGVVAVVVLAVLAGSTSSVAAGATRWAAPTAQGVGDCSSEANACTLEQAVSGGAGGAVAGDEVILRSDLGVFNLSSTLSLTMALQIHGKDGAPRPTIRLTDPTANPTIQPNNNSTLRHLRIERDGGDVGSAGVILTANDAVEDVEVVSSGTTQLGIYATAPVTIRDSTVWDTGSRIGAAIVLDDPSSGAVASQIRNVTAVGTGNNSGIQANTFGASGHHIWAVIKNAIAKGGGANPDVSVNTPGSTAKLDMYNSNFATASPAPVACNSAGTVAIRDCGNNQRASSPPLLANLSTGDFRELANSPTIDAGIDDGQLGPADPDGHPRTLGTAPDLGAYEYVSQQTLTVSKAGSGQGTVASSAAGIDCGSACQHTYDQGTAITLTATPAADSRFGGWSGGGCTATGACMLTLTADTNVTATFTAQHTLTVSKAGSGHGTVKSSPLGIDCGSACQHTYDRGTTITLTATPATGSRFAGWTGGGCSGTSTCTVTLNADSNATATFTVQSPALSALTVSPRKFALIGRQVKARCQATTKANRNRRHCTRPIALQISYKLNVAARVTFTIKRATAGRVVNGRCLKTTQTNRKRNPCILLTAIPGSLAASAAAGTNRFTFTGRIGGHKLTPGDYRLTATPVAYGHSGAPRTTPFSLTS